MIGRLFGHLAARTAVAFVASLAGVVALFLAVDFAENASILRGEGWILAAAELYLNRGAVVVWQVAPAAMLLAAGVTASGLRKTREYTALRSVGLGPSRLAAPVLTVCAAAAIALAAFGDAVVVRAAQRAEEILHQKFQRTSRFAARAQEQKRWFRGRDGSRIYNLRGSGEGGTFERVTVLELGEGFRLARRIDAARMIPAGEGQWTLVDVEERRFGEGMTAFERHASAVYRFDEDPAAFALRAGIPSQLRRAVLEEQIALRGRLGLPSADFALEWHRRISYPLAGVAAGLVALALALRRDRKGHLTASLVEAVGVSFAYWALDGICLSMGHAGRLAPGVAAWLPAALFLGAGITAIRRLG